MKTYRIVLCCSAGMSTSLLEVKMQEEAKRLGLNLVCKAIPAGEAKTIREGWDLIMIGPQVKYLLPFFQKNVVIPSVSINPTHYALANGKEVLATAIKIIDKA